MCGRFVSLLGLLCLASSFKLSSTKLGLKQHRRLSYQV